MLLSPEVDAIKARMMAVLVKDSEGFFDDPREAESLGITVRIACEFFIFLEESSGVPKFDEADYMAGTIRSGSFPHASPDQTDHTPPDSEAIR